MNLAIRHIISIILLMLVPFALPAQQKVTLGVMLPLHRNDGDGKRMLEYYRGMLLAAEDLKKQNVSVTIKAWNIPSTADLSTVLRSEVAGTCNIVFGPLYTPQVEEIGDFCRANDAKLVIPFSITGDDVDDNAFIYQVWQSPEELLSASADVFVTRFGDSHPIFIDCKDSKFPKGNFTAKLRSKLDKRGIKYSITSLNSSSAEFSKAFSDDNRNVIVLNSASSPSLNAAMHKLDDVMLSRPGAMISLFGYTEWLMYEKYDLNRFFKYDTYIPTTFYTNTSDWKTRQLERRYEEDFHEPMQTALPRFAISGYDYTMFFVNGWLQFGRTFTGSRWQQPYKAIQSPLKFVRTERGGFRNKCFMLVHYNTNLQIETLSY